jgi:hypothetical protein
MDFSLDQAALPSSDEQHVGPMHSRTWREKPPIFNSSAMLASLLQSVIFVDRCLSLIVVLFPDDYTLSTD